MPECEYCGASVPDETAYLDHLEAAHEDELGRIDRRRVAGGRSGGGRSARLRYLAIAAAVVLLAGAAYATLFSGGGGSAGIEARPLPESGDRALLSDVESFPSEGRAHVARGTPVDYDTSPPTSGPHYADWARGGYFDSPVPAGELVHSLEHGYVVVYYDPGALTPEAEESLRAFARTHDERWRSVIVVPNPSPESPYVLTAWRAMLRMDEYDPAVVRAFLAEYLGRGPENPVR